MHLKNWEHLLPSAKTPSPQVGEFLIARTKEAHQVGWSNSSYCYILSYHLIHFWIKTVSMVNISFYIF